VFASNISSLRSPMTVIGRTLSLGAICVCLIANSANAGDLEDAQSAYKRGDYAAALKLWQPLAAKGNAVAQTSLGILYQNGFAVQQDWTQAVAWYQKAAAQGNAEGEERLGEAYLLGVGGLSQNSNQGIAWLSKSFEHGDARSAYQIGQLYRTGILHISKDEAEAASWFQKSAEAGYAAAESALGTAYQLGLGVPQDSAKATYWYGKSADQYRTDAEGGDVASQMALGRFYEMGVAGFKVDKNAALSWYRKAAQQAGPLKSMAESSAARLEKALNSEGPGSTAK
jgi:TPR repeat protein